MIEIFKIIREYAPPIMDDLLIFTKNTHNIRYFQFTLKTKDNKTQKWCEMARRQHPIKQLSFWHIPKRSTY